MLCWETNTSIILFLIMIRIGGAMEADNVTYKEMKDLFFQDSFFLLSLFLTLQLTGMFIVVMLMANKKICSL